MLALLRNTEGNLLDDEGLVAALNTSKTTSGAIKVGVGWGWGSRDGGGAVRCAPGALGGCEQGRQGGLSVLVWEATSASNHLAVRTLPGPACPSLTPTLRHPLFTPPDACARGRGDAGLHQ